jgi:hypothetical protein
MLKQLFRWLGLEMLHAGTFTPLTEGDADIFHCGEYGFKATVVLTPPPRAERLKHEDGKVSWDLDSSVKGIAYSVEHELDPDSSPWKRYTYYVVLTELPRRRFPQAQ